MADQTVKPVKSPPGTATTFPDQQDFSASSTAGVVLAFVPDAELILFDVLVFTSPVVTNPA